MRARFGSVVEWTGPAGTQTRRSFTCCHCNTVVIVKLRARAAECGGFCRMCMRPTCTACADKGCTPFEAQIEAYEARSRLLAAVERQ